MPYYEEKTLFVITPSGEEKPLNLQPAFDVLKDLHLDQNISDEERKFLRVQ